MANEQSALKIDTVFNTVGDAKAYAAIKKQAESISKLVQETNKLSIAEEKEAKAKEHQDRVIAKIEAAMARQNASTDKLVKQTLTYNNTIDKNTNALEKQIKTITRKTQTEDGTIVSINKMTTFQQKSNSMWLLGNETLDKYIKRMNNVRWAMVNVTFALAGIAAALSPIIILGKWGMELETLFTKIEVVTDRVASQVSEDISQLRDNTMFSLEEMGEGFLQFTKQGFSASDAMSSMPSIAALSAVGFTDMGTAADMVSQMLHVFNMDANKSSHIVDVLAKAANESRADVNDFGIAMSYVAPIAAQAGYSFEETAAALAILTNKGLTASKAGTSLAAMITQIISPTEKTIEEMENLGISFTDTEGNFKSLHNLSLEFAAATDGSAESLKFLADAMQVRGGRAMAAFINDLDNGGVSIKEFEQLLNDEGYALERLEKIQNTTTGQMKIAWNEFKQSFVNDAEAVQKSILTILNAYNYLADEKKPTVLSDIKETIMPKSLSDSGSNMLDSLNFLISSLTGTDLKEKFKIDNSSISETSDIIDGILVNSVFFLDNLKNADTSALNRLEEATIKATQALQAYNNVLESLSSKYAGMLQTSQEKSLSEIFDDIVNAQTKALGAGKDVSGFNKFLLDIGMQKANVKVYVDQLEQAEQATKYWENNIESLKSDLTDEKDKLDDLNESLKNVNATIKELSSPRFTGQLEIEKLISGTERYMKEQNLASYGIIDVQQFLQDSIAASADGYDSLIDSINRTTNAAKSSQDTYEAWKETVKEFIKSSLEAGNELGKNVSGAVNQYATLLLSTSRFNDSTENQSQAVSLLKDAYDVYYGGMTDEVKYAVQAHEEANSTIYGSSMDVISALQLQWTEQSRLNDAIDVTSSVIENLSERIDMGQEVLDSYKDKIEQITDKLNEMVTAATKAAYALIGGTGGTGSSLITNQGNAGLSSRATDLGYFRGSDGNIHAPGDIGTQFNDFVMRPGQKPISFSSQDTLVGFKGDLPSGEINIQSIIINGVSGDANNFAAEFARELKRQLKTR